MMFASTTFMGVSMCTRMSRRLFVASAYAMLLAFAVACERGFGRQHLESTHAVLFFCILMTRGMFGRLIPQSAMPEPSSTAIIDLTLLPGRRKAVSGELDERELSVRNKNVFVAYRTLASWSVLVWFAVICFMDSRMPFDRLLIQAFVVINVAFALTLPQALILWNEPDLPEEQ